MRVDRTVYLPSRRHAFESEEPTHRRSGQRCELDDQEHLGVSEKLLSNVGAALGRSYWLAKHESGKSFWRRRPVVLVLASEKRRATSVNLSAKEKDPRRLKVATRGARILEAAVGHQKRRKGAAGSEGTVSFLEDNHWAIGFSH
jgi:hypothetical protein